MSSRYDEHAQYDRPRRHTRPRTKDRPSYEDAPIGRVVTRDRGRYGVHFDESSTSDTSAGAEGLVMAMRARSLGRTAVVVGDLVRVVGDVTGHPDTLARIVQVEPRATVLRRTADDDDPIERIVVANAQRLVIVTALDDPPPRPQLIDRCLVAAYDAGMTPLLCLTKSDLASPADLLEAYDPLGVQSVVTRRGDDPVELRAQLADGVSVLVGHSGVGKSTLVNALVPDADRNTAAVNVVTGRGRHTSTSAVALRLPSGGWIVDTPGFRSFGLAHVTPDRLLEAFGDLAEVTRDCPRGCDHTGQAPECALDAAVAAETLDGRRVRSFRRVLESLFSSDR